MRTSDAGLKFLMSEEGKRNYAYPDPATGGEPWTIGVGHCGPEVHEGLHWTDDQVMAALRQDVKRCEDAINGHVHAVLSQNQFDALVSWIFNVGVGAAISSTLFRKLNAEDYQGAAAEFPRWCIPAMLIPRRGRERKLFETPDERQAA